MREITVKDICTIKSGKRLPKGTDFAECATKHPYIRARDIKDGQIHTDELVYIDDSVFEKIKKYIINTGDIAITVVGASIGDVGYATQEVDGYNLTENAVRLTDFDKDVNSKYVFYYLNSDLGQTYMKQVAGGAAQPKLGIYKVESIPLVLPDRETQNKISDILSKYDLLIENNQKQIKLLEEAAQRLYKEWFVDLRFPGYEGTEIVDGVPDGWRYGSITDISTCFDKNRKPLSSIEREKQAKIYPYYGAASLMDYVEKYIFDGVYLLFGEDGTVITSEGTPMLQYVWGKFWVNNHAHVFQGKKEYSTEFLYMFCKNMKVSDVVTGVAQPKISQGRLNEKKILIPDKNLAAKYSANTDSMFKRIRILSDEIILCKEARDRLLPKLMNGEIEV